LLEVLL